MLTRGRAVAGRHGLFEYGIHTEESDIRAHVSVVNQTIYVFETYRGVEAIERVSPPLKTAGQPGVDGPTAEGWIVPVDAIEDLRRVRFVSWDGWPEFSPHLPTGEKGDMAVECVIESMRRGRFPLWLDCMEDSRVDAQIAGTDILIAFSKRVQVKCDYRGGDKPRGSGNLFLQRAERNPLKQRGAAAAQPLRVSSAVVALVPSQDRPAVDQDELTTPAVLPLTPCSSCGAGLYPDGRCANMLCPSYFVRGEPVERSPYDYTRSCAVCAGPVYKSGQCIKMFCDGRAAEDRGRS